MSNGTDLFRLPWTSTDNAMVWLEPTRSCNIQCDACFAINDKDSQKSLERIEYELRGLLGLKTCDAVLIAGGEPLTHPRIVEICRMVKAQGVKPVLVTNGVGLTPSLLHELKAAGLKGVTLHVDSHQHRPGWEGRNESELNELRQDFADMLRREKGLVCSFNTTIFPDSLQEIPDIVRWALHNIDRVQVLSLIAVRTMDPNGPYAFYAGRRRVDIAEMAYSSDIPYRDLTAGEIFAQVKRVLPLFRLCAYIGGTIHARSLKWSLGCQIGFRDESVGALGAKSMEVIQLFHHFQRRRYLAYAPRKYSRRGRSLLFFGVFDPVIRRAGLRYLSRLVRRPSLLFKRLHTQSINIMQPVDILASGQTDTCDGCPNQTLWRDRLVPSCRLDDYLRFGTILRPLERRKNQGKPSKDEEDL